MTAFPELYIQWREREYRCIPNMDVLTMVEQRVPLQKLANAMVFDPESTPVSHVAWVIYCMLKVAGAQVDADTVWHALKDGELTDNDVANVMQFVITEVFTPQPEKGDPPKKAEPGQETPDFQTSTLKSSTA